MTSLEIGELFVAALVCALFVPATLCSVILYSLIFGAILGCGIALGDGFKLDNLKILCYAAGPIAVVMWDRNFESDDVASRIAMVGATLIGLWAGRRATYAYFRQ